MALDRERKVAPYKIDFVHSDFDIYRFYPSGCGIGTAGLS